MHIPEKDQISFKAHISNTIKLAYPVVIGQIGHVLMGTVDAIFEGGLGAVPLAAATLANSVFFLVFIAGLGVTFAITPLTAIAVGAKKPEQGNGILKNGLIVNLLVGLFLTTILLIGSFYLDYLKQQPEVTRLAVGYLRVLTLSIIPAMVFQTYKQFTEGFSVMKPAMVIMLLANLVNAGGNWVLIYGKLGMPQLGFIGSAWATFLTRICMSIAMVTYCINAEKFRSFRISFSLKDIERKVMKKVLSLGLSSGFQLFFEAGAFCISGIIIGWLGTSALAAHQIAQTLATITYMVTTGVSAAATVRVGNAVGRKATSEIRHAGFSAIMISAVWMTTMGIIFVVFRDSLPSIFINDFSVKAVASSLLLIAAFYEIADGVQCTALGALRGVTDVKFPAVITFISYWVLGLPIGYLLGFTFHMGVAGVWLGFVVGLNASALLLTTRFHVLSRKLGQGDLGMGR